MAGQEPLRAEERARRDRRAATCRSAICSRHSRAIHVRRPSGLCVVRVHVPLRGAREQFQSFQRRLAIGGGELTEHLRRHAPDRARTVASRSWTPAGVTRSGAPAILGSRSRRTYLRRSNRSIASDMVATRDAHVAGELGGPHGVDLVASSSMPSGTTIAWCLAALGPAADDGRVLGADPRSSRRRCPDSALDAERGTDARCWILVAIANCELQGIRC